MPTLVSSNEIETDESNTKIYDFEINYNYLFKSPDYFSKDGSFIRICYFEFNVFY